MIISLLNEKITIQKTKIVEDKIGNHTNKWVDYFKVSATISKESPREETSAGNVFDDSKIDFTIRYSSEVKDINSTEFRVKFRDNFYELKGINHMNYKKKSIKLHCKRLER